MFLTYAFADCGWSLRLFHGASPLSPTGASEKRSSLSVLEALLLESRAMWNSLVSLAFLPLLLIAEDPDCPVFCCVSCAS
ncbi:hypothetical protein NPIL_411371 [Nephila pilipes]|uniref:Uncharacterized protein n=1 Tax=Nephila pilipes TaxID=299642 RepID=A0A8X6MEN2_NEPPI|nr:hypothetical protein NPIL_411371 [Nephila pilipes]